jgi:outer membrane protein
MRPRTLITLSAAVASTLVAGCETPLPMLPVDDTRSRTIDAIELPVATTPPANDMPTNVEAERNISLADARAEALRNNLDLQVSRFDPAVERAQLEAEQAAFESVFTLQGRYAKLDQPGGRDERTNLPLVNQSETWFIQPGLRMPLRSGGAIEIAVPWTRRDIEATGFGNDPDVEYTSDLSVSVSQPLLRNFGRDASEQRIRLASVRERSAQVQTTLAVIGVLTDVDRAYWRLDAARAVLATRVAGLQIATAQLDRSTRRAQAGTAPQTEVVRARAGVSDQKLLIVEAELDARNRQRELKKLINAAELPMNGPTLLIPDSPAQRMDVDVDESALMAAALNKRGELLRSELAIAEQSINLAAARNAMRPLVNLTYRYNINGLGGEPDDALPTDLDYQDHTIGIEAEVPIGNRRARSDYRRALLERLKALSSRQQQEQQIRLEVLNAIDDMNTAMQRIRAGEENVQANQKLVEAETRQFDQGQRTSTEVLAAVEALQQSMINLIRARAEYQIAQVDLAFACGMTLGQTGTTWDPMPQPAIP